MRLCLPSAGSKACVTTPGGAPVFITLHWYRSTVSLVVVNLLLSLYTKLHCSVCRIQYHLWDHLLSTRGIGMYSLQLKITVVHCAKHGHIYSLTLYTSPLILETGNSLYAPGWPWTKSLQLHSPEYPWDYSWAPWSVTLVRWFLWFQCSHEIRSSSVTSITNTIYSSYTN